MVPEVFRVQVAQKAEGSRQQAESRRQKAVGSRRKAEGRRQEAVGSREKAGLVRFVRDLTPGAASRPDLFRLATERRSHSALRGVKAATLVIGRSFIQPTAYCLLPTAYCLLPTAYCLLPSASKQIR